MGLALFFKEKLASPMGLATPHNFLIQPVSTRSDNGKSQGTCHFYKTKLASPMGLATPHNFLIQPVSTRSDNGKSHGTCPFFKEKIGKSHWTCHYQSVSTQAESGSYGEWQVQWDLPIFSLKK